MSGFPNTLFEAFPIAFHYSFGCQFYFLLCSDTQQAPAVSRTSQAGFGISSLLAQSLTFVVTFRPFDCEHEEILHLVTPAVIHTGRRQ
jgi:hypothetical protein